MKEEWKVIKDWEQLYMISNFGRVFDIVNIKYLKHYNSGGYDVVYLIKEHPTLKKLTRHYQSVHRLVALHFIEQIPEKIEVNHIDGNKRNNIVSNLEWVSRIENLRHARDILGYKSKHPFIAKPVVQIDKETLEVIDTFPSITEASKQTDISNLNIGSVVNKHSNTAGGYIFISAEEYKENN